MSWEWKQYRMVRKFDGAEIERAVKDIKKRIDVGSVRADIYLCECVCVRLSVR